MPSPHWSPYIASILSAAALIRGSGSPINSIADLPRESHAQRTPARWLYTRGKSWSAEITNGDSRLRREEQDDIWLLKKLREYLLRLQCDTGFTFATAPISSAPPEDLLAAACPGLSQLPYSFTHPISDCPTSVQIDSDSGLISWLLN